MCAPNKATLKTENHALECTTAGPYIAIPSNLLGVSSVCGLGPDLVGIHSISLVLVRPRLGKASRKSSGHISSLFVRLSLNSHIDFVDSFVYFCVFPCTAYLHLADLLSDYLPNSTCTDLYSLHFSFQQFTRAPATDP